MGGIWISFPCQAIIQHGFSRNILQVPGERSLGTYNLDILNDDIHVSLPLTSEVIILSSWSSNVSCHMCFELNSLRANLSYSSD